MKVFGFTVLVWTISLTAFGSSLDSLKVALQYQKLPEEQTQTIFYLSQAMMEQDLEGIDSLLSQGISIANTHQLYQWLGQLYFQKGRYYDQQRNFNDAYFNFALAEKISLDTDDFTLLGKSQIALGKYLTETNRTVEAAAKFKSAAALLVNEGREDLLAYLHENMGYLQISTRAYEDANQEFALAYSFASKAENLSMQAKTAYTLANNLIYDGLLEEAKVYLDKAEAHALALGSEIHQLRTYFNLGFYWRKVGNLEKAETFYQKAYEMSLAHDPNIEDINFRACEYAKLLIGQERFAEAISILEHRAQQIDSSPGKYSLRVLSILANTYEQLGQFSQALATERHHREGSVARSISESQALMARKDAEVTLALSRLNDLEDKAGLKKERQRWLMLIGLVVIVGILVWIRQYRITVRHRKQAEANATHWPELDRRMDALQRALNVLGEP
ncbi:MAG TPA: hypothetical protein DCE41_27210 [Cytophagales bacterium]|nr:hypothetical protein [Cytophagales bacterium]HAA21938.1 hypothetical protein [Cytophagales bacterium]HAP61365.1 hypothetical protein [Cytophagales bacterium]